MPDPLAHPAEMTNLPALKIHPLPRFWWLWPWPVVGQLYETLKFYGMIADLDDRIIRRQERQIKDLNDGIERLARTIRRNRDVPYRE
jgi:hypothetical protein